MLAIEPAYSWTTVWSFPPKSHGVRVGIMEDSIGVSFDIGEGGYTLCVYEPQLAGRMKSASYGIGS